MDIKKISSPVIESQDLCASSLESEKSQHRKADNHHLRHPDCHKAQRLHNCSFRATPPQQTPEFK